MQAFTVKALWIDSQSVAPNSLVEISDEEFARLAEMGYVRTPTKEDLVLDNIEDAVIVDEAAETAAAEAAAAEAAAAEAAAAEAAAAEAAAAEAAAAEAAAAEAAAAEAAAAEAAAAEAAAAEAAAKKPRKADKPAATDDDL